MFTQIWNDEWFCSLSDDAQKCFLYLLSSPHSNLIGLYVLKFGYACEDLKYSAERFQKAMAELLKADTQVAFDDKTSVIWLKNHLKYNPIASPNHAKACVDAILSLPRTSLILEFLKHLQAHPEWLSDGVRRAFETELDRRWKGLRTALPTASERPGQARRHPETEAVTETERNTLSGKSDLKAQALEVLSFLNQKTGKNYRPVEANVGMIIARLKSGIPKAQLFQIIAKKCRDWGADEKMAPYLRPATLFNKTKCEQYLGELGARREDKT